MECKSCGAYYKGKVCPKCGYGGKTKSSKAAAKYKKATKPERFRTAEDNELYARWDAEREQERVKDPNASKKFLAIVAVVAVAMVLIALFQSGVIFSNTRTEVVEQYFTALSQGDYDSYLKCFPKAIRSEIEADRDAAGLSKKEYIFEVYDSLSEVYGQGYSIGRPSFGRETELSKDEYDLSGFSSAHGSSPSVSEVYELVADVTFSGTVKSDTVRLYFYLGRNGGYWRIYGMEEDSGMIGGDDAPAN